MAYTLADLLSPESAGTIRDRIVAELLAAGAPTASWGPSETGGMENLRLDVVSEALKEFLSGRVAELARDGLLERATGDGLRFYARARYEITPRTASKTVQNIGLYLVGTASAKTFAVGALVVANPGTGHRYRNIDAGTVQPGHTLSNPLNVRFEAEAAGSIYDDAAETITQMVVAPSGIRCINRRPSDFSDARVTGSSTGRITGAFAVLNVPPAYDSIRISITASGDVGAASFRYSTDGGSTWSPPATVPAVFNIGTSATLFFTNGAPGASFIIGDIFTLLVADAILQRGADAESDESIRARCRAKWTTLTLVPLAGTVELWSKLASDEVERVLVDASPTVPGTILVTIASSTGPASPRAVLDVEDYISVRLNGYRNMPRLGSFYSPEEKAIVSSAKKRQITAGGVVSVPRAKVATVQAAAEAAWTAHLRTVPLGPRGVVRLSELVQAVMDSGAVDFQSETLNGVGANISLEAHEVATPADGTTLATTLFWRPV